MQYMVQHHHTLRNLPFAELNGITVLLVEPEAENRSFYSSQLSGVNMNVVTSDTLERMQQMVQESSPDVVIVNPSENISFGINSVKQLKQEFPSLPVITMSLTMREDHLDAIMESGVSLHINRGLTRPRDLLLALEQVLAVNQI
ncbi:MAG TPA: response regulator [Patescibacteria group bacterium]|jgi:CheY-like chemotaxis protein|nr:response regulator [Patescibacteria group bacterium]